MGPIKPVEKVKLFAAVLSSDENILNNARERLSLTFGPVDYQSPVHPWTHSNYYEKEMGTHLKRTFLFFARLIPQYILQDIKIMTNDLEDDFRNLSGVTSPARPVNIDPGYMSLAKVVLASTKDFYHRMYIGRGIYAEVTLYYKDKSFHSFPHTYPEYRSEDYISMFNQVRASMAVAPTLVVGKLPGINELHKNKCKGRTY